MKDSHLHNNLLTETQQKRLYLVHHMHHYKDGSEISHELHHCFLFSKPGMKGAKYSLSHLLTSGQLYHILDRRPSGTLFDHSNHRFKAREINLNNKIYFYID